MIRRLDWDAMKRLALILVVLLGLAPGCDSPPRAPSSQSGPIPQAPNAPAGLAAAIDAALAEAARHIQATRPASADSPATVNLIELATLENHTAASEADFAEYAQALQVTIRRLATRHGLVVAEGGAAGLSAYQMHIAILPIDGADGMWLAQMQLFGRKGTGEYGMVWSDTALVPAP